MNRRDACRLLAAAAVAGPTLAAEARAVVKRRIPSSGEQIPVIGMGSSNTFDVEDSTSAKDPLREVLRALVEGGGTVIDTSPMYGRSDAALGGPIHVMPASSIERAKAAFSARKPYPGWIASAPA